MTTRRNANGQFFDEIGYAFLSEFGGSLADWQEHVNHLIEKHGPDIRVQLERPTLGETALVLLREHKRSGE